MSATNRRRATAAGFLGALVVIAAVIWLVGPDELLATLVRADRSTLGLLLLVTAAWIGAWALALRTVLAILGIRVGVRDSVLLFVVTVFANNVTPFGQAGGEPVSALLISAVSDSEYETSLAAVVSLDALKVVPSVAFGLLGLAYYAATLTLSDRLEVAAITLLAMAIFLPVGGALVWRHRQRAKAGVARALVVPLAALSRAIPRWRAPDAAAIESRIEGFLEALEQVADDPRAIAVALSWSTLGWFGLVGALWVSLLALGFTDPRLLAASVVTVALGNVAGATPFPGGLGGIEAAFVVLLVSLSGLPAAGVGAAVLLYRIATYWLPTVVGAGAASAFGTTAWW